MKTARERFKKFIEDFYLVLVLVFLYAPILVMMVLSFNSSKSRSQWGGFTLKWYTQMFESATIMDALYNTLLIAFLSALIATILGTAAAIGLSAMKKLPRTICMGLNNIPMLNSDIVTGISLMLMFIAFGISLGFKTILGELPEERQTVMFSATMPHAIAQIAQKFQKDPKMVQVVKKELTVPKVTQYYYEVKPRNKVEVMCRLLDLYSPKLSVAFCNTKKQVDELVQALQGRGYFAEGLHGDLKQEQRDRVMGSFRNGATEILVATDVAARGIDVDDVEAVFNYDIPQDDEYYVHRIGRTGRAGREGRAFSLAVGSEVYKLRDIQRFCKTKIVPQPIPSLDDVTAIKAEKILDDVQQHIGDDSNLERMTDIIEKRLLAEDYTSLELAAAFLKMAMGDDYEDIADEGRPLRDLDDLDRRGGRNDRGRNGRRRQRGDDEEYMDRKNARGGMTRLFINLGKNQNVKPGDILGAIAGESGIPGRLVGSIDMYDKYTFVEVPKEQADIVMDAMNHVKIKGKSVHVEKANRR